MKPKSLGIFIAASLALGIGTQAVAAPSFVEMQVNNPQVKGGVIKSESQLARKGEAMMHKTSNAIYKYVP